MNPVREYIDYYKVDNMTEINRLLQDQSKVALIGIWLADHPKETTQSPLLSGLKKRITPSNESSFSRFATFFQSFIRTSDSITTENIITQGNFTSLIPYFERYPERFFFYFNLIKTYIELNVIEGEQLLVILPFLLNHACKEDIQNILKLIPSPIQNFETFTKGQILRLTTLHTINTNFSYEKEFKKILESKKDLKTVLSEIDSLADLSDKEKNEAVALYIEHHKIPLNQFSDEERLLKIAPNLRFLDFKNFNNVDLAKNIIKDCPYINTLKIDNKDLLEGIRELPYCQEFDCSESQATSLPDLPECKKVFCCNCEYLKSLPDLPLCRVLDISGSTIQSLPNLPNCQELNISRSLVESLPDLPFCQKLNVSSTKIISLPDLPFCEILLCKKCWKLKALPKLPLCKEVYCEDCIDLAIITYLPLCEKIDCNKCNNLTSLPELPFCKVLDMTGTFFLKNIPLLSKCEKVICRNCGNDIKFPPLPCCKEFDYAGTFIKEFPEMPFDAILTSENYGSYKLKITQKISSLSLQIDCDQFKDNPAALLTQFIENLLKNINNIPSIYLFNNNKINNKIPIGIHRRLLFTKIIKHIFGTNGLKLQDGFPIARDSDEQAYRSLGKLLAFCSSPYSPYKTGPFFRPIIYDLLNAEDLGEDNWYLKCFFVNSHVSDPVKKYLLFASHTEIFPFINELSNLAHPFKLEQQPHNRLYFDLSHKDITKAVIDNIKIQYNFNALIWIAEELKRNKKTYTNLQLAVEGDYHLETLIKKLKWSSDLNQKDAEASTRGFFKNWLRDHPEKIPDFLFATTGVQACGANEINIRFVDQEEGALPTAEPIYYRFNLGTNDKNQAEFDEKMDQFLKKALEDDFGFAG